MGVTRVIIGTKAVSDFDWFRDIAQTFPGQIVLGLDARGAMVATHGWLEESSQSVLDFARRADELPLAAIIYTDITQGLECYRVRISSGRRPWLRRSRPRSLLPGASRRLKIFADSTPSAWPGVVVGRSLYEGTLTLTDALAAAT